MVLGKVNIGEGGRSGNVSIYFDKHAGSLIDSYMVFDKAGLRFRNATIDDGKTYKANRINGTLACVVSAKFPDIDGLLGEYEVEESEDGMWYIMYKV
jgi:hypothetical protein